MKVKYVKIDNNYKPGYTDILMFNFKTRLAQSDEEKIVIRSSSPKDALSEFKTRYPKEQIWQLGVDGIMATKEGGWRCYENREPGSLKAFFNGLKHIEEKFDDRKISKKLFFDLHKIVTEDVKKLDNFPHGAFRVRFIDEEGKEIPARFSVNSAGRGTKEGFADLLDKIEKGDLGSAKVSVLTPIGKVEFSLKTAETIKEDLARKDYPTDTQSIAAYSINERETEVYWAPLVDEIEGLIDKVIENYNTHIEKNLTDDEKLLLIGQTIEALERIHPFGDANGKTFVNLLLNRLLMQNGFPPATFYEPNLFDTFGNHVAVLKRAIQNTIDIYNHRPVYGFNILRDLAEKGADLEWFEQFPTLKEFTAAMPKNILLEILEAIQDIPKKTLLDLLNNPEQSLDPQDKLFLIDQAYKVLRKTLTPKTIVTLKAAYIDIIKSVPYIGKMDWPTDFKLKALNHGIESQANNSPLFAEDTKEINDLRKLTTLGVERDLSYLRNKDRLQKIINLIEHEFTSNVSTNAKEIYNHLRQRLSIYNHPQADVPNEEYQKIVNYIYNLLLNEEYQEVGIFIHNLLLTGLDKQSRAIINQSNKEEFPMSFYREILEMIPIDSYDMEYQTILTELS
ncbi:hypothetical protein ACQUW5_10910 [Legionella sp. CNM-1927-20]|uniref:hypothetical protein n=1 Tax=Legionella sp. CNM-1927-20 TaxID=3422221 RepID=UPI00403AC855